MTDIGIKDLWCDFISYRNFDVYKFYFGNSSLLDNDDFGLINLYKYPSVEEELDDITKRLDIINYEKDMFDSTSSSLERLKRAMRYTELENDYHKLLEYNKNVSDDIMFINGCTDLIMKDYGIDDYNCMIMKKKGITINNYYKHLY